MHNKRLVNKLLSTDKSVMECSGGAVGTLGRRWTMPWLDGEGEEARSKHIQIVRTGLLKGQCHEIFFTLDNFIKHLLLVPVDMPRKDIKFF
jgi:hypothetical protein